MERERKIERVKLEINKESNKKGTKERNNNKRESKNFRNPQIYLA
jgi:hypothetical protein